LACAVCFGLAAPSGDSAVAATYLRGGVKAGDRSGLNLVRPPAPGKPRFAKPQRPGAKREGRAKATQDWFWQITEPGVHAASPARWDSALETLRRNRSERGPLYGEGTLSRVAGLWGGQIRAAARRLSALGQGGEPRDVAEAIVFLCTPSSVGITGAVVRVCGGALVGA
jgi:hypothetical protein